MTRMEDFLSIQNYKFIVEYISHKVKSDHQIEIDITKYDNKIYYFMDKLQVMSEQNDKLNKHKANMFVANKILNLAKPEINKELQRQQTTIQRGGER